ncbi:hypothetical protein OHT61_31505 [Streptomyces sp. NBC_00178]|uniref:hypothetical protein n=1 Tax=Streptomyces sp. NBC_00178 TaxID=2975672 RepID=UPI002E2D9CD4|nr:hypothetical protein [Streptomyces sp. NBC_00178]
MYAESESDPIARARESLETHRAVCKPCRAEGRMCPAAKFLSRTHNDLVRAMRR